MRAAVLYEANTPIVIEDVTLVGGPGRDEVLVRIAATGICHSDYHVVNGTWHGEDYPLPVVLGHEASAIVEEVGSDVKRLKRGDHVILSFVPTCGRCRFCASGEQHLCNGTKFKMGTLADGSRRIKVGDTTLWHFGAMSSYADYSIVHESQAIPIPLDFPLDRAALIGCATMTGVGAVLNTAKVEPGSTMAVFATGGVGLNVVQGGVLASASKIIAIDLLDNKLEFARSVGATHLVNSGRDDPIAAIKEITGGVGVDYAFDAIGLPKVSRQAYDVTRRGGTTVVVGMAPTGDQIPIPATIAGLSKTVKGCFYGSTRPSIDFPRLVDFDQRGLLQLGKIISRHYRLEDVNEAFDALHRGDNARGIMVLATA
ncbi:MAG TPA: Zn-dependent alcohol dehydrogenase [Chloroflexota bacterium]|nr:Zn-dependent alcohol dehydrogenase [Chloroflexota bacterium]